MKIINEFFDEFTNEYVLEFDTTKEEQEIIEKIREENGYDFFNDLINNFAKWAIENPIEFSKWIKEHREDKCNIGTIGKPFFKENDIVGFYITPCDEENEIFCIGKVFIIDAYGTCEQNDEPSYDIMVDNYNNTGRSCLVKHVRESSCYNISKNLEKNIEDNCL